MMKGFVKCDKYFADVAESKAPRMIQFAEPAVNVELAQHLGPAEHAFLAGPGSGPSETPDCSKGMTTSARAATWAAKRAQFSKPVCLLGDFSKFDSHVHTHVLAMEHDFWSMTTQIDRRHLDRQLINDVTACGMTWRAVGTRMSGTYNTGGGNSVINIMIMRTIARLTGITIEMLCDGDDSLVFMNADNVDKFAECCSQVIPRVFGMKWEYSAVSDASAEEYCHAALSFGPDGAPICLVDPVRALARLASVVNKEGGHQLGKQLVASLVGIYCTYPNHPVLSRVSHAMLRHIGAIDDSDSVIHRFERPENEFLREQFVLNTEGLVDSDTELIKLPPSYLDIDEGARHDVASSFGIDVATQLYLEQDFVKEVVLNPSLRYRSFRKADVEQVREELLFTNDHITPSSLF
jgi:hypothetical protein